MKITLNGEITTTAATTVAELINEITNGKPEGVAVALNGEVVPKSQWERTIPDNAQLDVLNAVQGG